MRNPLVALMLAILSCCAVILSAQSTIRVDVQMTGAGNSLFLYEFNGVGFSPRHSVTAEKPGVFILEIPRQASRLFFLGQSSDQVFPVVLGEEDLVQIAGSADNVPGLIVSQSKAHQSYDMLKQTIAAMNGEMGEIMQGMGEGDAAQKEKLLQQMTALDNRKLRLLDSLRQSNPFLARVMALNAYQSYALGNRDNRYPDELSYFVNEFFAQVDFSDPGYDHLIWLYETFRTYVNVLVNAGVVEVQLDQILTGIIDQTPAGSHARLQCLGGAIAVMQTQKHPLLMKYGKRFIAEFETKAPEAAMELTDMLQRTMRLMEGSPAPEFSQVAPDGKPVKLSDFRGKYVLLDFWASWCGPCRRENPNVVRMYSKYKDKGFEILGISLDQNRERWLQAIQADQLTWKHTSDLKGWSNEVGKLYEISAIPKTFLIDPKGVIIARDLRGAALDGKLEEIFSAASGQGGR